MTRAKKIVLIVGASLAGLLLLLVVAGIVIVQTDWFRNTVRTKMVTAVEEATGGRTEVGSFAFDWHRLQADVRNFVIHGLEPAGSDPLFRADHLQVNLKLTSPFTGFVDIAYLLVESPRANLMVFPDGRTNIPEPKLKKKSDKSGLETIVELAIGKFDLKDAQVKFADQQTSLNASGENLRAHLDYNPIMPRYTGQIDVTPLVFASGKNPPLRANLKLPVTLEKDKITVANADLRTGQSVVTISGAMEHMDAPRTSAHINAQIAVAEVADALGLSKDLDLARGPKIMNADITAAMDDNRIRIDSGRVTYGQSSIEASGVLKDPNRPGAVQFNSTLALGEVGRLLRLAQHPEGTVKIGGNASLRQNNDYLVTANVDARNVALTQGGKRLTGINLDSSVTADPHRIELAGLRLAALGGSFNGSAALEEMTLFRLNGNLRNFDIDQVARVFLARPLGYDGIVSGPVQAEGNIKNTSTLVARANLGIAPGRRGVPVSGKLAVDYNGRADTVRVARSYLQLPHTRVDLSGELGQQIQARVVSRNLADFRPLGEIPIALNNGGAATVNATISGKLSAPKITAQALVTNFSADGRSFSRLAADLAATKSGASVSNGTLERGALQARFAGSVGLRDWKPESYEPVRLDATIRNADAADVLALAGQSDIKMTGTLTADAHINGTVGSPAGTADLSVVNGTFEGERYDSLVTHVVMTERLIDVPTLQWIAGPSRIDASASYHHPVNDLKRGDLKAHVASNQVQLANFQALVKERPGLRGVVTLNADATAKVQPVPAGSEVQLTNLNANVAARNIQMEGRNLGDLTATATTAGNSIRYDVNSDFAGSTIRVNGQSEIAGDHRTNATAQISNLPIEQVLAVAGRSDLRVKGLLAANAQVAGTLKDPRGNGTFNVTKATAFDETIDRLQATVNYTNRLIDVPNLRLDSGPQYLEATASFEHPPDDMQQGQVRFRARTNEWQLARVAAVRNARPGLDGAVQLAAEGAAALRPNSAPLFSALNAKVAAKGINVNKKPLGDLTATAETRGGEVLFNLASDLAHADIKGNGRLGLGGDYPVNARVTFANLTYSGLQPLLAGTAQPFEARADGQVEISGPLERTDALRGTFQVSKLEARSATTPNGRKARTAFELHNAGPIVASLEKSLITIRSARIEGPYTNLSVTGTAPISGQGTMNLRADGDVKLEVLQAFNPDIFSGGSIALNAAVTGTTSKPQINGRLQLQNASLNMVDIPNGLSNGNGTIVFNGTQAQIQSLTGESGGGKISLSGFASYGGSEMQFRIQASADQVRVEAPATITTRASARLTLAGTTTRSLISGTVTVLDVVMHSHSDVGSILTSAATPPASSTPTEGILGGMRFDVKIQTAPDAQFRTNLTENLHADANLTLRGSMDHPGMIGRVVVTSGEVVFFGNKYTIDQGTVAFYNPQKINPILNIDLATTVQGVDVSLSVSGPAERMKLSYRSDPPMQFSDLVSLLASGKLSTTDPVLAARQPPPQEQNLAQMGASTVLSQAVANPVSGRLQRLFGVSRLKIDPQITGSSSTPQATMTLQQQITRDLTFTYIQDITQSNPQIIRIEWAMNPQFSAVAQRDLNGIFDLDFFYKRRFR